MTRELTTHRVDQSDKSLVIKALDDGRSYLIEWPDQVQLPDKVLDTTQACALRFQDQKKAGVTEEALLAIISDRLRQKLTWRWPDHHPIRALSCILQHCEEALALLHEFPGK